MKNVHGDVLGLIGNTPMVKLNKVTNGIKPIILCKLEWYNIGGSLKDRAALSMILGAEKRGVLKKGDTIVEPTSGNTGIAVATVAIVRGYNVILVAHNKISSEKKKIIEALGAELIITDSKAPFGTPEHYYTMAKRISEENKNRHMLDQYFNQANPMAHLSTANEIWEQTEGRVNVCFIGMGTGGTITGVGRGLKSKDRDIKIIGVDPHGSIFSTASFPFPQEIEGIGESTRIPGVFDQRFIDEIIKVVDKDAFLMARKVAKEEGLLVGGSSGAAIYCALKYSENLLEEDVVVVLCPDSGERYLSKFFSDEWMKEKGFIK